MARLRKNPLIKYKPPIYLTTRVEEAGEITVAKWQIRVRAKSALGMKGLDSISIEFLKIMSAARLLPEDVLN